MMTRSGSARAAYPWMQAAGWWCLALLLAGGVCARADSATNPVPQTESFEAYADGLLIDQVPAWSIGAQADVQTGWVTTSAFARAALAAYTNAGGTLPLDTTHSKVLTLGGPVAQRVAGPARRLVRADCLLLPTRCAEFPAPDPAVLVGLCFDTNGQAVVLHHDAVANTNAWLTLAQAPPVPAQSWVRVTFLQDYANHLFQLRLNDGPPISDAHGWSGPPPGGTQPGPWFCMPNTNAALSRVLFDGAGEAFLDDFSLVSELPEVLTLPASNVTASSADLVGYLTYTGLAQTAVEVYWGTTDGGTNAAAWAQTNVWTAPRAPGRYAHPAAMTSNTVVYYRYAAANAYGTMWATSSEVVVVGDIRIDATADNQASERPTDPGVFRFMRPAWTTNVAITVHYAMSGTASNGVDYVRLPGSVTMPAGGATTLELQVIPIPDGIPEPDETAVLQLLPGAYLVGSPSTRTVTIKSGQPLSLTWDNTSGDMNWNSTSVNWLGSPDGQFFELDQVTFENNDLTTGRVYMGSATWVPGGNRWTNATPLDVRPGALTVTGGLYEFEGGAVAGCPATLQGGRVIQRELGQATFGTDPLTLSGGAEFWRQVPGDATARAPVFSNAVRVAGTGTLQGGPGVNAWRGGVDLQARLNIGFTNPVVGHVNQFAGVLAVNQDTNLAAARVVALQAGGGQAFLDGPIVDDPDTNHTGAFPLWLETGVGAGPLTLRGANTYAHGTVVTNAGGTNAVVVAAGSSLGGGPITLSAGARLTVQAAGVVTQPLTIPTNATVTLSVDGAVVASLVTVTNGGLLVLQSGNCLPDEGVLRLGQTGRVQIGTNLIETVAELYVNAAPMPGGRYTRLNLANILGDGTLKVGGQVPAGMLLLVR